MNAGALALELPDAFELEPTGQLTIGVDGEQRALPMLAPEGKPAPVRHSSDHTAPAPTWTPATAEELAELAAEHVGELELEELAPRSSRSSRRRYHCAYCGRELEPDRWVYSSATGSRYCPPSDPRGCNTPRAYAKQERTRARARKEG